MGSLVQVPVRLAKFKLSPLGIPFIINWWQRWSIYACDFGASTKHKYTTWHMSTWQSIRSMVRRRINGLHDICLAPPSQPATQKNYTPQVKMFCNKKNSAHFKLRWKRKILSNTITITNSGSDKRRRVEVRQMEIETMSTSIARTTCKIINALATRRI